MKSLLKAIAILNTFSPNKPELTVADISDKLNIPKPTVYRMLSFLTKAGMLEKKTEKGTYVIGRTLYTLGSLYLSTTDLFTAAEPVIKTLNDLTAEVTNLAILDDKGYITYVMREESKHALRHVVHVGSTAPAYAHALGKALLSELTDAEIDGLYPEEKLKPLTKKTVPTKTELKYELEQIRKSGVAFNFEQAHEGVEAVAAMIRNASGKAIAATAIPVPIVRMNEVRRKKLASLIKMGAGLISYRLGYQDKTQPLHKVEDLYVWWQQNQTDEISQSDLDVNTKVSGHDDAYTRQLA